MKTANDWNTHHKNWENLENIKYFYQSHKQILVYWTKSCYFWVNSAIELFQKQHENICNQTHTVNVEVINVFGLWLQINICNICRQSICNVILTQQVAYYYHHIPEKKYLKYLNRIELSDV